MNSKGLINPIQDGPSQGCLRMMRDGEGGEGETFLPKICHTYPTMVKLYIGIGKIQKNI